MKILFFSLIYLSKVLQVFSGTNTVFPEIVIFDPQTNQVVEQPFVEYLKPMNSNRTFKALSDHTKNYRDHLREESGNQGEEEQSNGPCFCRNETVGPMCGCCFGMRIDRFNFSRECK